MIKERRDEESDPPGPVAHLGKDFIMTSDRTFDHDRNLDHDRLRDEHRQPDRERDLGRDRHADDHITALRDADAYDVNGDKIGSVGEVYLDDRTGEPTWVTVNTGLFGLSTNFVPMEGARLEGDRLIVSHSKDVVTDAPRVDEDGHITREQEDDLYRYYNVSGDTHEGLRDDELRTRRWEDDRGRGDHRDIARDDRRVGGHDARHDGPDESVDASLLDGDRDAHGRDHRGPVDEFIDDDPNRTHRA